MSERRELVHAVFHVVILVANITLTVINVSFYLGAHIR